MNKQKEFKLPSELSQAIKDIVWMARRYADGRMTYAPDMFNTSYKTIKRYVYFDESIDPDNRDDKHRPIQNFPLATYGRKK